MPDSRYVSAGKPKIGGAVFAGDQTSPLPTDETTTIDPSFEDQGYCSADGLTRTIEASFNAVNAWGGEEVLNSKASESVHYKFTLIESSPAALKSVFGADNVTVIPPAGDQSGRIIVTINGADLPRRPWVFDLAFENQLRRQVIPIGKIVTSSVETTYKDTDPISLPVEIACYKDSDGNYVYEYFNTGITEDNED